MEPAGLGGSDQQERLARDRAKFEDALLEVELIGEERRHQRGQRDSGEGSGAGPTVPALSHGQQLLDRRQREERGQSVLGAGAGAGSAAPGDLSPAGAERELASRFEQGGVQLAGEKGACWCYRY